MRKKREVVLLPKQNTVSVDPQFWAALDTGLLLALRDQGLLTPAQCDQALMMARSKGGKTGWQKQK